MKFDKRFAFRVREEVCGVVRRKLYESCAPTAFLARDILIRDLAAQGIYVDRDDVRPAERRVMSKEVGL